MTRTSAPGPPQPTSPTIPTAAGTSAPAEHREKTSTSPSTNRPAAESSNAARKRHLPPHEKSSAKRLRASLAASHSARFFSGYQFAPGIVLPSELLPTRGRGMREKTTLASVLAQVVAGAELDAGLIAEFGLRGDLHYRFAEIKKGNAQETALLGYRADRRLIEVAHRVEFDPNPMHFSRTDSTDYGRELARNIDLAAGQTGTVAAVRINGMTQLMLVARNTKTNRIENVQGMGPYADIVPAIRGFMARVEIRQRAQASTPYPDFGTYLFATHNLRHDRMPGVGDERTKGEEGEKQRKDEWDLYRSSISIGLLDEPYAYIYNVKKRSDLTRELKRRGVPNSLEPKKIPGLGHLYTSKTHSMRMNTAWLLGLAHRATPVVMATPLEEATLVHAAAPPGERRVEERASAFIREIVAMLRNDYFAVSEDEHGKKIFHPTEKAQMATLDQMLTPRGMDRGDVEALLARYGLHIEPDQPTVPEPRYLFDFMEWVTNLLLQDLKAPDGDFPRLDTCIRAGVAIPPEIFRKVREKLTAAAPQENGRLTAMLCKMVESVDDDANAADALLHASSALPNIETVEDRKALTGLIYDKAMSLRSEQERERVRAMLSADVVAAELLVSCDIGLPLVQHLGMLHASGEANADSRAGGRMFPVGRMTLAAVVQARDLAPDAMEKTLDLLRFLLQTGERDEPPTDALFSLARELPYFRSEELQVAAMRLALDVALHISDPDVRNDARFFIGRAMSMMEADRPKPDAQSLIESLQRNGIPIEADFIGTAAVQIARAPEERADELAFIRALLRALPEAKEQEKALIRATEAFPELRSRDRLDRLLAMILEEAGRIGVTIREALSPAVCINLLWRPEEDHEHTLRRLEHFGIAPGLPLLADVLRTIDAPHCRHGGQLCRLAVEIVNRIPAEIKAGAMNDMLFCFQSRPFLPEKRALLDAVLGNIALAGGWHDEPMSLERQIVKALDTAQHELMELPDVHDILRSVRHAIPESFESDPALAFARLELAETDAQRKKILDGLLEELSEFASIPAARFEKVNDLIELACSRIESREMWSEALERLAAVLERENKAAEPWVIERVQLPISLLLSKGTELSLRGMKSVIIALETLEDLGNQILWHVMHDIGAQLGLPPRDRSVAELLHDARDEIARREGAEQDEHAT